MKGNAFASLRTLRSLSLWKRSGLQRFSSIQLGSQFGGHDSAMEWSFFVTEIALKRLHPWTRRDEASLLRAFGANREKIYAAATKAYARQRKGSYELSVADF
jgi:hypothetical protein